MYWYLGSVLCGVRQIASVHLSTCYWILAGPGMLEQRGKKEEKRRKKTHLNNNKNYSMRLYYRQLP